MFIELTGVVAVCALKENLSSEYQRCLRLFSPSFFKMENINITFISLVKGYLLVEIQKMDYKSKSGRFTVNKEV